MWFQPSICTMCEWISCFCQSSDAGEYKCVASNDAGTSEGVAMLTVQGEHLIEPNSKKNLQNDHFSSSSFASLIVVLSSIVSKIKQKCSEQDFLSSYSLSVRLDYLPISEIIWDLHVISEPPSFRIEPTNRRVVQGSTVVMDCVAEGEPAPDISWLRGWRDIVTGERISVLHNNSLRCVSLH